jgi:exonuclease SbcC
VPEEYHRTDLLNRAKDKLRKRMTALEAALRKAQKELELGAQDLAAKEASCEAAEEHAALTAQRRLVQQQEFAASLQNAGFHDEAAFKQAKRAVDEIAPLEADILAFDRDRESARDRMTRAVQGAAGLIHPDMEALEQAALSAREALTSSVREEATLKESFKRIGSWLRDHENYARELGALEERYAIVGRLAEVSGGSNKDGITFQRFVLAALLDDVLATASKRLHLMSNGRFYLQRVKDRTDRRTAGGLDLEVHDTYTGTTRPASSLSGGESFLASLSLALGLADVVQSYAGGMRLETIFVDEGFGSLDDEALDQALRALIDLQQTGRLVGIISHVRDLRERIDTRLEITADRRGSMARFVVG